MNEYLTQAKRTDLEVELEYCKLIRRPEILERLLAAFELGDLPENAEYESSREEQRKNEERIQKIETILKHAKIIKRSDLNKVELGASVIVKNLIDDSKKEYLIVDTAEADIGQNKISTSSPMGSVMIGKKKGDIFTISTLRGDVSYEIIMIA